MPNITDVIFDLTNEVAYQNTQVTAYLRSDQGINLNYPDGSPVPPIGAAKGTDSTDSAGIYTISGLVAGTVYDLWVEPVDQDPFWIPTRVPDVANTIVPCILYGTMLDARETDIVWAFLEVPCVTTEGLHINQGVRLSEVSRTGSFSLGLWPTLSLIPGALYRVTLGKSTYRGSVPSQASIKLKDWIALSTTQVLSS